EGAASAAAAVAEEFAAAGDRILVVGMLAGAGKSPEDMLGALGAAGASLVVACAPPSPRALPAAAVAEAAEGLGVRAVEADSVEEALALALRAARPEDLILVAGSLYVVGAARQVLGAPAG
ncbi:MAG TPA: hypothetical protein VKV25_08635, partial [Acidimicrobiales bacterium]|nr:hypothetical protein [Acidimicrobiales bacterium]